MRMLGITLFVAALSSACVIDPVELEGRPCVSEGDCVDGWSCRAGTCQRVAVCEDAGSPVLDAGVLDAGVVDGGAPDGGYDAGVVDGGTADAGYDAGTVDAGVVDVDAGPAVCGDGIRQLGAEDCDPASGRPGASAGCTTGCTIVSGWTCGGTRTTCVEQLDGGPVVVVMPGGAPSLLEAIQLADPDGTVFVSGGPYDEYLDLGDARATVIADGPVQLTSPDVWVIRVAGTTTTSVRFEGFEISNSNGGGVMTDTDTASIELVGNRIGPTTDHGVRLRRGTDFLVEGNFVFDNEQGAVRIERGPFTVVNNILVNNGKPGAMMAGSHAGGLRLRETGVARFNTIVGNFAEDMRPAGVFCENAGVVVEGNYIVDNGLGATGVQLSAACEVADNLVGTPSDGGRADPVTLGFLPGGDYHLAAGAVCIDYVAADGGVTEDIDGEPRPAGAAYDCGADEVQ